MASSTPKTRKTRIVCISDTHNQTPKLPPGDVLIHAGDLTNQGSYSELQKTVTWLEKADFEAKIVVAGNHDMTLDPTFYEEIAKHKFKWSGPQDTTACIKLLTESKSITYLNHTSASIYLTSPSGPGTCFKVFGSPYSPGQRGWAFQYPLTEPGKTNVEAERLWEKIEGDTDVVVTHTPARGHVDTATKDDRAGCEVLKRRLGVVRPGLAVCGHIHEGRGVERVKWKEPSQLLPTPQDHEDGLVESVEYWTDPGAGNKKVSLVDLAGKTGRRLDNTRSSIRHVVPESLRGLFGGQPDVLRLRQAVSAPSLEDVALPTQYQDNEAGMWIRKDGGAVEWRRRSDVGLEEVEGRRLAKYAVAEDVRLNGEETHMPAGRRETVIINAAFLGPRIVGKAMEFNKPIVVDIELPVWEFEN